MIYFTSDWHLGEERIGVNGKPNLFYRPFKSISEQNDTIMNNFYNIFKDGDTLYHLGDVVNGNLENAGRRLKEMRITYPNSKFILIEGNYDEDKEGFLCKYFDEIRKDLTLNIKGIGNCYLNHYPTKTLNGLGINKLGVTGHIHSLWKVQENLINVGVDAWNFRIVSEDELAFCYNAMENFYDRDVFPYCN
tara:strand:- start:3 stop:575 length:573 start_codon:yes stop_codon:yes gene_type:complete